MSTESGKKRSFSESNSSQNKSSDGPKSKKQRLNKSHHHQNNKNRKFNKRKGKRGKSKKKLKYHKNGPTKYVRYNEPDNFNHTTSHCLECHPISPFTNESHLHKIITNELNAWYQIKKEKKIEVATDGVIDIHLIHNRHSVEISGYAFIYFSNKSDASYILQLSKQKKLKNQKRKLQCQWKEPDRDNYSNIYQTDINLKGIAKIIKISNLHWKTTIFHLNQLFINLNNSNNDEAKKEEENEDNHHEDEDIDIKSSEKRVADITPRWIRIMEDKNGFPKCQALVMLNHAKDAIYCVDKLSGDNTKLLGRKPVFEYSCYMHNGEPFSKYNTNNMMLGGVTKKLLLSNIRQSVIVNDIAKLLKSVIDEQEDDKGKYDEIIKDIYLFHNTLRVSGGKCFVTFNTKENAEKYWEILQFKQLCDRTLIVEYGHLKFERDNINENSLGLKDKTNRLFMTNLVWDIRDKDIYRFFGAQNDNDKIKSIYYNVSPTGFPKGSAFITFATNEIASAAFDKSNGKKLRTRQVRLDYAEPLHHYNGDENGNNYNEYNDGGNDYNQYNNDDNDYNQYNNNNY